MDTRPQNWASNSAINNTGWWENHRWQFNYIVAFLESQCFYRFKILKKMIVRFDALQNDAVNFNTPELFIDFDRITVNYSQEYYYNWTFILPLLLIFMFRRWLHRFEYIIIYRNFFFFTFWIYLYNIDKRIKVSSERYLLLRIAKMPVSNYQSTIHT